jgi:hypothetical protein
MASVQHTYRILSAHAGYAQRHLLGNYMKTLDKLRQRETISGDFVALSRRKHGFESRRGHHLTDCTHRSLRSP